MHNHSKWYADVFFRRRQKGRPAPKLEASWEAIVWGTPASLALTLCLALMINAQSATLIAVFWLGLTALTITALVFGKVKKTQTVLKTALIIFTLSAILTQGLLNVNDVWSLATLPVSATAIGVLLLFIYPFVTKFRQLVPNLP